MEQEPAVHPSSEINNQALAKSAMETEANKGFRLRLSRTLSSFKGPISCVRYAPNGSLLAVSSADRSISIFETANYSLKFILEGHEKGVNYIAWSPDSKYLASCSDDKTARIWNSETGSLVRIFNTFSQFPTCIAYNPRGTIIACSCSDETIYFFSVYTRNLEKSIFAHSNTISSIEFNASGSELLSSSIDGFSRIWDCESGDCLQSIRSSTSNSPMYLQFPRFHIA
ncbi:uncharacterized protein [Blastocystis hominis]|uniref:WDR90 4th beta-propeller domain-containing protein n=1 Tax=Blastocystis hominis TaxID=12968 RepID=D8M2B7_BLAHO|nr:uncharacterized protein [Blastocystis hominis]CBK22212.2 unnamed protein product [Blastocystis hominis]|eukprot:XP_012896260.1 uncharacterized protein [Blastocystis hominis]